MNATDSINKINGLLNLNLTLRNEKIKKQKGLKIISINEQLGKFGCRTTALIEQLPSVQKIENNGGFGAVIYLK